jgi:serine/threonine-protein kinase HipA
LADALPDGWGMLLMDRALRRAGRNPHTVSVLERLAMVGDTAFGALSFEPANGEPTELLTRAQLSLGELAQQVQTVLADTHERTSAEQLRTLMQLGGSPQGARPKVLLRDDSSQGNPWLIKFPAQGEPPEVCAVEELYARLARLGGMDMPVSHYFDLGPKHSAFGVQRFDRVSQANGALDWRVPLISAAALLEADYRLPSLDYETLLLATARLTGDQRETQKAFERCVFNVLLHNRDDHAKNFAYRLDEYRQWKLSPAFDLTYSHGPGGEHSTSVAGEGAAPGRAHLMQVAKRGGLPEKAATRCIDHWRDVLSALPMVADELPIRRKTLVEIERCVGQVR